MIACTLSRPCTDFARGWDSDLSIAVFIVVSWLITWSAAPFFFEVFNNNRMFLSSRLDKPIVC